MVYELVYNSRRERDLPNLHVDSLLLIKFYKSRFNGFNPLITGWDEPVNRKFNGKDIQGRKTKAFGTTTILNMQVGCINAYYLWTQPMKYIKGNLETFIKQEFGRTVDFNFLFIIGYYALMVKVYHVNSDMYLP